MGIRKTSNRIGPDIEKKLKQLQNIAPQAYDYFKNITPKRSGNARSNTNYQNKPNGGIILGDYPYANRLNDGYSKQAPDGMTMPTIAKIRQLIKRVL